jgi:YD repeat-containing protein
MKKLHLFLRIVQSILSAVMLLAIPLAVHADEPVPSFYQEAGLSPNRGYENQHANEHIDPFSGKLQWHYVDLHVPGNGGLDINVARSYSSLNETLKEYSSVGAGWTIHFGRIIRKESYSYCDMNAKGANNPVLELADGSRQILYPSVDKQYYVTTSMWKATCRSDFGMDVYSPDGLKYEMSTFGPGTAPDGVQLIVNWVTRIVDLNGNALNFTYAYHSAKMIWGISSINASDGRSVSFNYCVGAGCTGPQGSLQSITDGQRTWTYVHRAVPEYIAPYFYLDQVIRPDGQSWSYEYYPERTLTTSLWGGHSLKKVTYPTGGVITYSYSQINFAPGQYQPLSTVVTQKNADNAVWNYAYTPATQQVSAGATLTFDPDATNAEWDKTVVDGPEGATTYLHYGYNSVPGVGTYLIGSLFGKAMATRVGSKLTYSQFELNGWAPGLISNQPNTRPGLFVFYDPRTNKPLLTERVITRSAVLHRTKFSNYDAYFNPQTIVETGTDTRTTTISYFTNPAKWIIQKKLSEVVDTIPGATSRTYDVNANVLTESRYGVTTTFTYHPSGDVASKTDARDFSTTYSDYFRGIPRLEIQPEGVIINRTVSPAGNVLTEKDGENAITTFTYDSLSRLTSIEHPIGNPVNITWGKNKRTLQRGSYTEEIIFDGYGRETEYTYKGGSNLLMSQKHAYDKLGRKIFSSYPNSSIGTAFKVDILGRQTGIYHGANATATSFESSRTLTYATNETTTQNERSLIYKHKYRVYGDPDKRELIEIITPSNTMNVSITRNGLGQPLVITQGTKSRTYSYDANYFQIGSTDPETGVTVIGRDAVGNMTSRKVGTSAVTNFGYDGRNRMTSITYPSVIPPSNPSNAANVERTFFKDDKLKSIDNGVARRDYLYNTNKNLIQEKLTVAGQNPFIMTYEYDSNDSLHKLAYSSGRSVTYKPDAFGRATEASPYVENVNHHPTGQVSNIKYANGVVTDVGFNTRSWPINLRIARGTNQYVQSAYGYDANSNVTVINDTIATSFNRNMTYDGVDRLISATGSWGNLGSIAYDANGSISQMQLGSGINQTYSYDPTTRLASIAGSKTYAFSYDTYGNVIGNGSNTFIYNDAANMRCVNCGLANEITYNYDGANMRVMSTKAGVSTFYVYASNGNLLTEITPNVKLKDYIYLHGKQVAVHEKLLP